MLPLSALARTSELSSPGERAERSSSAGSMPSRRTMALAALFRPVMSQRNAEANPACSHTTERATSIGWAIARFFGTSSPKTIDSTVARTSDSTVAVPEAIPAGRPTASRTGRISSATAGSAM